MAYKDQEKRREYDRNYKRQRRAVGLTVCQTSNLEPVRIKTAQDVLKLLEETLNEVRSTDGDALIKARCIGFLASVTLKAVETANLEGRIEALEETLKLREVKR